MERLTDLYHINATNLELRRRFLQFDQRDLDVLRKLIPWADRVAEALVHELHEQLFRSTAIRSSFERYAEQNHASLKQMRSYLADQHCEQFRQLFREAEQAHAYGNLYFEQLMRIGKQAFAWQIPLKCCIGAFAVYHDLLRRYLIRAFPLRPVLRQRGEHALNCILSYDLQAIVDAYLHEYLRSFGFDPSRLTIPSSEVDISDMSGSVVQAISEPLDQIVRGHMQRQSLAQEQLELLEDVDLQTTSFQNALDQGSEALQQLAADLQFAKIQSGILEGAFDQQEPQLVQAQFVQALQSQQQLKQALEQVDSAHGQAASTTTVLSQQLEMLRQQEALASEQAQQAHDALQANTEQCQRIGQTVVQFDTMVARLNSIAGKQSMLALNAAVEAGRLADQGRGFSVVADQIRTMADDIQQIALVCKNLTSELSQAHKLLASSNLGEFLYTKHLNELAKYATTMHNQVEQLDLDLHSMAQSLEQSHTHANDLGEALTQAQSQQQQFITWYQQQRSKQAALQSLLSQLAEQSDQQSQSYVYVVEAMSQYVLLLQHIYASAHELATLSQEIQQWSKNLPLVQEEVAESLAYTHTQNPLFRVLSQATPAAQEPARSSGFRRIRK